MSGRVEVEPARPEERGVLTNLLQLYVHDFSELWRGRPEGELGEDGLFAPYGPLDLYWREPGRLPFLVRIDGRLAGFALINDVAHSGLPVDRNMAEFFIVRKHRRGGAGRAAALTLFARLPGVWETAVVRSNAAALAFWRNAVATSPLTEGIEELDRADAQWDGPILRFRVRGEAGGQG